MPMPSTVKTGQRFGKLTAIQKLPPLSGRTIWHFKCDCGKEISARLNHVCAGSTTSCGCYMKEWTVDRFTTHARSHTTEYYIWTSIKQRCTNKNHKYYKHYGGRGIKVCAAWLHSFETFLHDVGPRPKGLTLDRINNDGNYEPSNCRWASYKEQRANSRPVISYRARLLSSSKLALKPCP